MKSPKIPSTQHGYKHFRNEHETTHMPDRALSRPLLTLGIRTVIVTTILFTLIAIEVCSKGVLTQWDLHISHWFEKHGTSSLTMLVKIWTNIHGAIGIMLLFLLFAIWLYYRAERVWLWVLCLSVPGGIILNTILKFLFARARPVFEHPLVVAHGYSFPSGHTSRATLFYGMLAIYLLSHISGASKRIAITIATLLIIMAVAVSRLYLGAHYFSDVLAAMLEGIGWLALCIIISFHIRQRLMHNQHGSTHR